MSVSGHGGMPCPIDGAQLVMSERQGIEIDYCPQCRGVWLDRGELDKILERSAGEAAPAASAPRTEPQSDESWTPREHYREDQGSYRHKRKKSFFEELFD